VVFFAARTHNQLDQVTRELRRTAYRPLTTTLASRERYCLHPPALKPGANRAAECEKATYKKDMTCKHLERAEAIAWPQADPHLARFLPGGDLQAADIEDLVRAGVAETVCPYHTSRDLLPLGAGLVLVTYVQLLSPQVRKANGLNLLLKDAIVIFDEAHNVPGAAREAATLEVNAPGLGVVLEELGRMEKALAAASYFEVPEKDNHLRTLRALRGLVARLREWLLASTARGVPGVWKTDSAAGSAAARARPGSRTARWRSSW
jgi:Rad3-related DNA helicase